MDMLLHPQGHQYLSAPFRCYSAWNLLFLMQIVELDAQFHVVQGGKLLDQVEALEDKADIPVPAECPLFFAHPTGILAHERV